MSSVKVRVMFGGDQPRKHREAAAFEDEIVIAAAKLDAAHLDHAQPPSFRAEFLGGLLKRDHAVGDAVQLQVVRVGCPVVQHQHGAIAAGEELLQRQDLAPVAQRVLRQQPHFRQAVEDDPRRAQLLDALHHFAGRLAQLDFRGMQDRLLAVGIELALVDQFEQR